MSLGLFSVRYIEATEVTEEPATEVFEVTEPEPEPVSESEPEPENTVVTEAEHHDYVQIKEQHAFHDYAEDFGDDDEDFSVDNDLVEFDEWDRGWFTVGSGDEYSYTMTREIAEREANREYRVVMFTVD